MKELPPSPLTASFPLASLCELPVETSLALFEQASEPLSFEAGLPHAPLRYHARFYRRAEWSPERPLLVCLHGYKNNLYSFADLIPRLGEPAVSLDLRGFGQSAAPEPPHISLADYLLDLQHLLSHLQAKKVWLVGHSLGARVSTVFAALFPERVARVVLLDGFYRLHTGSDWMIRMRRFLQESTEPIKPRPTVDAERLARFFVRQTPGMSETLARYLGEKSHTLLPDGAPVADWQEWHNRTTPVSFPDDFMQDAVDRLQCPALALQTEETPAGFVALSRNNPRISVVHFNAGHQLHWQVPEAVARAIRQWRERSGNG